jgi:predicted RNase H-like HicB family nuclease
MEKFTAIYEDGENGWIVATCPEVPGAITQGRTIEEARENLRDAIHEMLAVLREDAEREIDGRHVVREKPRSVSRRLRPSPWCYATHLHGLANLPEPSDRQAHQRPPAHRDRQRNGARDLQTARHPAAVAPSAGRSTLEADPAELLSSV